MCDDIKGLCHTPVFIFGSLTKLPRLVLNSPCFSVTCDLLVLDFQLAGITDLHTKLSSRFMCVCVYANFTNFPVLLV